MRYLTLAEALTIAEAVTGLDPTTLAKASRLELLDSALHTPQAGFGNEDFYPDTEQKAASSGTLQVHATHSGSGPGLHVAALPPGFA